MYRHAPDITTLAACTWLACGMVLYGLTPLPLHTGGWGWTLAFWSLAAPATMLLARRLFKPVPATTRPRTRRIRATPPARRVRRAPRTPERFARITR